MVKAVLRATVAAREARLSVGRDAERLNYCDDYKPDWGQTGQYSGENQENGRPMALTYDPRCNGPNSWERGCEQEYEEVDAGGGTRATVQRGAQGGRDDCTADQDEPADLQVLDPARRVQFGHVNLSR